jgi:hypothetical protein
MRFAVPSAALCALCLAGAASTVPAQTYRSLHNFGGSVTNAGGKTGPDGTNSNANVTLDSAGDIFGTASAGGANSVGLVWEITATGVYKDLHDFGGTVTNAGGSSGPDGANPIGGVTLDANGNLYGTASEGGPNNAENGGYGMVWEITAAGEYKDLHDFGGTVNNADGKSGPDGVLPYGNVAFDGSGNMYGTTSGGGPNDTDSGGDGLIWEISPTGAYSDLHDFGGTIKYTNGSTGPDGVYPAAGVVVDSHGNLYGVTPWGGANDQSSGGDGLLWELTSGPTYKDLHDFGGSITNANGKTGPDGTAPWGGIVFDQNGNLYGTTLYGGPNMTDADSGGILWIYGKSGTYKDLHDFGGAVTNANGKSGPDGNRVVAGVSYDGSASLYGTALYGGPNDETDGGDGIIWKFTISGSKYVDLHDFGGTITNPNGSTTPDGLDPEAGVTVDAGGNLYGTTYFGGPNDASVGGDGVTWLLSSAALSSVSLAPSTVVGGASSTGTVTLSTLAPAGGVIVSLTSSSKTATVPAFLSVPGGSKTATFTVKTIAVATNTTATIGGTFIATKTATLTIDAPALTTLTLSPTSLYGGASSTGTVTLNGRAPTSGVVLTLSSSSASAVVPASVTVPAGATSATFTVKTTAVAANVVIKISATNGATSKSATLTIDAPVLTAFTVNPTSITGAGTVIGTLTISSPAPAAGASISVKSNTSYAAVPATVTIAAGLTTTTFKVTITKPAVTTTATLSASYGGATKTATIVIKP